LILQLLLLLPKLADTIPKFLQELSHLSGVITRARLLSLLLLLLLLLDELAHTGMKLVRYFY
jgi:hypothetical protein